MTPLHINILLHYHARVDDYRAHAALSEPAHAASPAVAEFLEWLEKQGLLTCQFGDVAWATRQDDPAKYKEPLFAITDKGQAMVLALCAVQVPICKWVQP